MVAGRVGVFPEQIVKGKLFPLGNISKNKAAELTLVSVRFAKEIADLKASQGKVFMILDTSWKNIISPVQARDESLPVAYAIPQLKNHVFLIADGKPLDLVHPSETKGFLPDDDFVIPQIGMVVRGRVACEIFEGKAPAQLQFKVLDSAQGNILFSLRGPQEISVKPLFPLQKNAVVEGGIFGLSESSEWNGEKAPPGMIFRTIDFKAKSLMMLECEAGIYDPKAKPGEKIRVATLTDWTQYNQYIQLVLDGEFCYSPRSAGEPPENLRFLPDIFSGESWVFLVPEKSRSMSLHCSFPKFLIDGGDEQTGTPLNFVIQGPETPTAPGVGIVSAEDEPFKLIVKGRESMSEFAGEKAPEGTTYLVLTVSVWNNGKSGEFFQTKEQLKLAVGQDEQLEYDEISLRGNYPPAPRIWIPAGTHRTFQVAWPREASAKDPKLAFTGEKKAVILDLK